MKKRKKNAEGRLKTAWYMTQIHWNRMIGNWMLRYLRLPLTSPALLRRARRLTEIWIRLNPVNRRPDETCLSTQGTGVQDESPKRRMCGSGK